MDSILNTIKQMLGYAPDYTPFDEELKPLINSSFRRLNQLAVGKSRFEITGPSETWSDFLGADKEKFSDVKEYIYFYVKLRHDPPQHSFVVSNIQENLKELEWRLNVDAETYVEGDVAV